MGGGRPAEGSVDGTGSRPMAEDCVQVQQVRRVLRVADRFTSEQKGRICDVVTGPQVSGDL